MKILIVDDHPKRYERLITSLRDLGIARDCVEIVGCSTVAREYIEKWRYDLLILDILIPFRPETDEDAQHSVDLLFEIREGELANAPRYILGITADPLIAKDALQQFEEWTWTVLNYSDSSDEWVARAANCARFILSQPSSSDPSGPDRVDLAIICALVRPEQQEVLKLPWNWSSPRPINSMTFVRDGHLELDGRRFTVCVVTPPRMGMVSTAVLAASVISALKPRLVAMTGICAGVRGKVKLGDVLFADPSWDFQSGKRVRDANNTQFSMRPHQLPASARVRSHIELIKDDKEALLRIASEFPGDGSNVSRISVGPVASGSAVLADGEVIKEIRSQHSELIGVEMEIYGLYVASQLASDPQPEYFALKGVCDFADPDKEDGDQTYAAYASARVLQVLIERYGLRLIGDSSA